MKKFTFLLVTVFLLSGFTSNLMADNGPEKKISSLTQHYLKKWEKSKADKIETKNYDVITKKNKNRNSISNHEMAFTTINGVDYLKAFIKLTEDAETSFLNDLGVIINTLKEDIASCLIPVEGVTKVADHGNIITIETSKPVFHLLDSVRKCSNISPIHDGSYPLTSSYKGNGVIVGVVDEGFDFTHPNYYDADGENYRVLKVWSQVTTTGTAPSGYTLGSEYTTKEEILALETDNDEETHGTHTSGIAAGSGYKTQFMGVAPESDIILVATDMSTTGIMDGIQYIVDNAKDLDKPCVINLSLGSEVGPHDGTSIEDQLVDKLVGPGIVVVGACGNSGEDTIHIKKSFTGTAGESISTFLAPSSTETSEMYLDIWGRNNSVFDVTVSIYNYQTGQTTYTCNTVSVSSESTSQTFSTTNNEYYVAFENQLYSGNGDYNSLLVVEAENYFTSPEYVVVTISCSSADVVNMWATNGYLRSYGMSGYTAGDTDMTVGAVGGVGKQVISVGAYCTKTSWTDLDDQVYSYSSGAGDVLYAIAPFSSKGPTADDRIKPDIAAPGFGVVSGFNSYNSSYGQSCTESVATEVFNSRNYYWGVDQGTSMACPVITGTVALWLENNPKLTPDMIKNIFSEYSFASNVTRSSEKDNEFGWGKVDAFSGLQEAIALNITPAISIPEVELYVINSPYSDYVTIKSASLISSFQLSDISGRNISVESSSELKDEYTIDKNKLSSGVYIISVDTEKGKAVSKFIVK